MTRLGPEATPTETNAAAVRKTIEKAVQDMPALPDIVAKVIRETEREYSSSNHLEKLLGSDQALAAKTLRVVNSAYYGLAGQVSSLNQAVVILGMQQIRNLVLSISALSMMKASTPRQREIQRALWLHSFGTAGGAHLIGKKKRMDSTECELIFLGGLLHDIGKLFLFSNFTDTYQEVVNFAEKNSVSIGDAERRFLGMTHGDVGRELVGYWKLPEQIAELVGMHDGPFNADVHQTVLAVHIADRLTKDLYEEESPDRDIDAFALEWLGMANDEIDSLQQEIQVKVEAACDFFGLLAA